MRKGLDLPLDGAPEQTIDDAPPVRSVAVLGADYPGLKPSLTVHEGDRVALGQPLFHDRAHPEIHFTSPGAGIVRSINRGARRSLQSIVVDLDGDAKVGFKAFERDQLGTLQPDVIRDILLTSGSWTALRTRPFGDVAAPDSVPHALFVTAIDTNPLAADPAVVIAEQREAFSAGLTVIGRLVDAPIFLCRHDGATISAPDSGTVTVVDFKGPHPAGLVGTHIHLLAPVGPSRAVWHVGYQDVIAIGKLFTTGRLWVERVVALGGPGVRRPRLLRARLGAATADLVNGELDGAPSRIVSGSVLSGHRASGAAAFFGRYHNQLSVLPEAQPTSARALIPGTWSFYRRLWPSGRRRLTTALHGRTLAMFPVDTFERVMPLDILPTPLFRALLVGDVEMAQALGCLELDEEDLALCTFLCPSKIDYGAHLRSVLDEIRKQQ